MILTERYIGWWVDGRDLFIAGRVEFNPASTFLTAYFGSEPYPSLVQFAMNVGQPIGTTSGNYEEGIPTSTRINWFNQILPTIEKSNSKITMELFGNWNEYAAYATKNSSTTDPSALPALNQFLQGIKGYTNSIVGILFDYEYYGCSSNPTAVDDTYKAVTSVGYSFLNSAGYAKTEPNCNYIAFVEFPNSLNPSDSSLSAVYTGIRTNEIGRQMGESSAGIFPSSVVLPSDPTQIIPPPGGWNQQVVSAIIDNRLKVSLPQGALTVLDGWQGRDPTTDTVLPQPLWNNSLMRGYVWNDSNYKANYLLSNVSTTPPPPLKSFSVKLTSA